MASRITEITRRDIFDAMILQGFKWFGRLEDTEFLSRLFDLNRLPSTDSRFDDANGDIWQHRVNNFDWDDNWVYSDDRFQLMNGDDEIFLRFLCETIHPVVRPDSTEVEQLCQLYNDFLVNDHFQLVAKTRTSNRPIYVGRYVGVSSSALETAKNTLLTADAGYVAQQITRMESAVSNDPELAIGTAKELIETCCNTILNNTQTPIPKNLNVPQLVKLTVKQLQLTPNDIPDAAKAADTIKRLLSNLATIAQGMAELRNSYGTGHGKTMNRNGLQARHAKLAVGAASTLAVFLIETHDERKPETASNA